MQTLKYAVEFPELDHLDTKSPPSIFSEREIAQTEKTLKRSWNALDSLAGYVVEKNRTEELGKQISAQKSALNAQVREGIEQQKIQYEEEARRLKQMLKKNIEALEMEFQRLKVETAEQAKDFSFSYESYMKSSQSLRKIISSEKVRIEEAHAFLESWKDAYSNRREFIIYSECERSALMRINEYLKQMI